MKKILSEDLQNLLEKDCDWRVEEDPKLKAQKATSSLIEIIFQHTDRLNEVRVGMAQYDKRNYTSTFSHGLGELGVISFNRSRLESDEYALSINLLRSCCDTLLSKISKHGILPRIVTSGAHYHIRDKAKRTDRWVRGMFKKLKVRNYTTKALLHASIFGYGFVKVCCDGDKIELTTVNPDEIFVEMGDSHYGEPTTMYQTKLINKTELQSMFPEFVNEIENIPPVTDNFNGMRYGGASGRTTNTLIVAEVWDLPKGKKGEEGYIKGSHCIMCGDVMLFEEEWEVDYFPIIKIEYTPPITGFYPRGLAHILGGIQAEYDDVIARMAEAQDLISHPTILLREGSTLTPSKISNEIGTILEVTEMNDIQIINPVSIAGDTFNYAAEIKNSAYEISGISRLSAASRLPTGIDGASGRALREYNDMESERFSSLTLSWEAFHKDIAEIILKEINRCNMDFIVKNINKNSPLQPIKYKDLQLDIDDIVIQMFSVPDLPNKPSAKIQLAEELVQSGYLSPEEAADLIGMPDVDSTLELKTSPRKAVEKILSRVINEVNYFPDIDQFLDLEYFRLQALLHYNNVIANMDDEDDATNELLDKLKTILVQIDRIMQEEANRMAEAMPQGDPMADPMADMADPMAGMADPMAAMAGMADPMAAMAAPEAGGADPMADMLGQLM